MCCPNAAFCCTCEVAARPRQPGLLHKTIIFRSTLFSVALKGHQKETNHFRWLVLVPYIETNPFHCSTDLHAIGNARLRGRALTLNVWIHCCHNPGKAARLRTPTFYLLLISFFSFIFFWGGAGVPFLVTHTFVSPNMSSSFAMKTKEAILQSHHPTPFHKQPKVRVFHKLRDSPLNRRTSKLCDTKLTVIWLSFKLGFRLVSPQSRSNSRDPSTSQVWAKSHYRFTGNHRSFATLFGGGESPSTRTRVPGSQPLTSATVSQETTPRIRCGSTIAYPGVHILVTNFHSILTFPFFPGILLSRKPPGTQGRWLVFEKNRRLKKNGQVNP